MDYLNFNNWKNSHAPEMQDLTFARPDDIFIFTRCTSYFPFEWEGKEVLYAESIEEVIGYIRHIFLYDILNDLFDDLEYDNEINKQIKQDETIAIYNFWYKFGKLNQATDKIKEINHLLNEFNLFFKNRKYFEYEIQIFDGADELRKFLNKNYSNNENFDKRLLSNICSKELFAGKPLKEFLDKVLKVKISTNDM